MTTTCECASCGVVFTSVGAFDAHRTGGCPPDGRAVLRETRRTTVITMVNTETGHAGTVRVCEPDCRNEFLTDLAVPHAGHGGGWTYRSHGAEVVTVAWSGQGYRVAWKRTRANAIPCDACEHEWRYRIPVLVARAAEQSAARKGVAVAEFVPFPRK